MDTERTDTKEEEIDQPMDTNPELKHREANKPKRGRKKNIKQIYKVKVNLVIHFALKRSQLSLANWIRQWFV